jgi:phosphosulfolactate synthase
MEDLLRTLQLPQRPRKPRSWGLTMVIDGGLPLGLVEDLCAGCGELIDLWKFGWGTALVTPELQAKIAALRHAGVDFFFGGTLFEKFAARDRVDEYRAFCRQHGCRYVEVSNGTIGISNAEKAAHVAQLAREGFLVLSEVGYKDLARSALLSPGGWVNAVLEDLAAGAHLVLIEARESGRSGICDERGELRPGVLEAIERRGLVDSLIFEAPTKELQTRFIRQFGSRVNLGNVAPADVIGVETLRLGLRSDTFDLSEGGPGR